MKDTTKKPSIMQALESIIDTSIKAIDAMLHPVSYMAAIESSMDESMSSIDSLMTKPVALMQAFESAIDEYTKIITEMDDVQQVNTSALSAFESFIDEAIENIPGCVSNVVTLAALEAMIDESIAGLDTGDETPVTESVVSQLLEISKRVINNKCHNVEDCNEMLQAIATEAFKFNECLTTMAEAGKELKNNTITKDEFKERVAPAIESLKAECEIIGKVKADYVAEANGLNDEDIKTVREFIIGTESLIAAKKEEISGEATSLEDFLASCESMSISTDGVITYSVKIAFSQKKKEAKALYKEGKKLLRSKDFNGAIEKFKKAKTLFKDLKDELTKIPETELSHVTGIQQGKKTDLKSTANMYISKAVVDEYISSKVMACDQAIFSTENAKKKLEKKAHESTLEGFIEEYTGVVPEEAPIDDAVFESLIDSIVTESSDVYDTDDEDDDDGEDVATILESVENDNGGVAFESFLEDIAQ